MNELSTSEGALPLQSHDGSANQYLTFLLGQEKFGVNLLDVQEIIEVQPVTRIPMSPDFINGVFNLRGNVVAVIDLAKRLGKKPIILTKRSCLIIVDIEASERHQMIGLLVDEVSEITEISKEQLKDAPDFGCGIRTDFVEHMGHVGDDILILLAIDRILNLDELAEVWKATEKSSSIATETT